jgi:L-asparaginase/Glu-tRNA(Gln) amidotransferase subunit D
LWSPAPSVPTPHRRHTTRSEFDLAAVQRKPYVEIAYIHTGTHPGIANALVALGAKGIVIASYWHTGH